MSIERFLIFKYPMENSWFSNVNFKNRWFSDVNWKILNFQISIQKFLIFKYQMGKIGYENVVFCFILRVSSSKFTSFSDMYWSKRYL